MLSGSKKGCNVQIYNPIQTIERIAAEISEFYPCASVGLLTAATAIEVLLEKPSRDEQDRLALANHWAEHD
jgi:hypothetical protein